MRYLVTGGAGFIGANLCKRLLNEGHKVHVVDNLITGSEWNIIRDTNYWFEDCDIKDYYYKHDLKHSFDRVINLACPASPDAYLNAAFQTINASTVGVMNMLKAARHYGATFLQSSTSEVYGDPSVHPQPEEYWGHVNCWGPRACYDEGKRLAETIIYEFNKKHPESRNRVVRIFNTYGPRMRTNDGRVVSNFIVQALKNEPITIYGDGSQTRSFCYVDDLLDIMLKVLESDYQMPLNIGNPGEFTMLELAEVVKDVTGSKSELVFKPLPKDDPKQRRPDISRVKKFFNWEPKVSLREGIEKTVPYFDAQLKWPVPNGL